ncbi:GNAT family acetyltransferase [Ferrovibrio sp.]|uniref:GNAT family acetyltransferase n=1 Tax=Ferrovibrio sp. TaxID=1917215 RepID=UPI001B741B9B|nr:GNAT family acetyltransferase [Ferrovibrio sp.]MBP7065804.1 GNAT family acetyltransferase [Ferrovibrio sp.]
MFIRPFQAADRAAVIALWQVCGLTRPWNDPASDIDFCLASQEATLLVAEADGAVIGSAMVGHDGHRGWVYYLAASPAQQGKGLGRALMAAAEDWARARGVPKLMLMVRPENAGVRAFYEALGYIEEPRIIFTRRLDGA